MRRYSFLFAVVLIAFQFCTGRFSNDVYILHSFDYSISFSQYSGFSNSFFPPAQAPTVAPTSIDVVTIMTFANIQSLINCSAVQFKSSQNAQNVFQSAVAASTVGVTVDNVIITSITSSSRRLIAATENPSVGETTVDYNITIDLTQSRYSSPTDAYSAISTALVMSVSNGSFTTALTAAATATGDSVLRFASSGLITLFPPFVTTVDLSPTIAPTNAPHKKKTAPGKSLVLPLGVGFGVLLLGVMALVAFRRGDQDLKMVIYYDTSGASTSGAAGRVKPDPGTDSVSGCVVDRSAAYQL